MSREQTPDLFERTFVTTKVIMKQPSTPNKFPRFDVFQGKTFVLRIGKPEDDDEANSFNVHQGIASFYSGFFAAALNKDTFKEGKSNSVELPEEHDVELFRDLIGWMYTRKLSTRAENGNQFTVLLKLCILADRYMIPLLGNESITAQRGLVIALKAYPSGQCFNLVYNNSPEGCGLRKWISTLTALIRDKTVTGNDAFKKDQLSKDAIWDVLEARDTYTTLRMGKNSNISHGERVAKLDLCSDFHIHEDGEKCPAIEGVK